MIRGAVSAVLGLALGPGALASDVERTLVALASVGDLDRDGVDDVAVRTIRSGRFPELLAISTRTGEPVWTASPPVDDGLDFGGWPLQGVLALDDLDGDGTPEIAVVWRGCGKGIRDLARVTVPWSRTHRVAIHAGRDGQLLRLLRLPSELDTSEGTSILAAPDLDRDGSHDILVSAPGSHWRGGALLGISTRTGRPLFLCGSEQRWSPNGLGLSWIGDANADGVEDLAIGEVYTGCTGPVPYPWERNSPESCFRILVRSGRNGSRLGSVLDAWTRSKREPEPTLSLGWQLARAGDLDGDGTEDLFAPHPRREWSGDSVVCCVSGRTGQVLRELDPEIWTLELPEVGVRAMGDVDGDQVADVLISDPGWNLGRGDHSPGIDAGGLRVLSGRTGERIWLREGFEHYDRFGELVALARDSTGDGVPEVWASFAGGCRAPCLVLLSGRTGAMLQWVDLGRLAVESAR